MDAKEHAKFQSSYATILRVRLHQLAQASLQAITINIEGCKCVMQAYMDNLKKREKSKSKAAKK